MPPPNGLQIRKVTAEDIEPLTGKKFHSKNTFERFYREHRAGKRCMIVALLGEERVGHASIMWESRYSPFRDHGIPEILQIDVDEPFRRRGIGTALMDTLEGKIRERSPVAGIGVGLTHHYGPAQRLYLLRGYILDGHGIRTHYRPAKFGSQVMVDDDLCLFLTKRVAGDDSAQ